MLAFANRGLFQGTVGSGAKEERRSPEYLANADVSVGSTC